MKKSMRFLVSVLLLLTLLTMCTSVALAEWRVKTNDGDHLNLRSTTKGGVVIDSLPNGTILTVLEEQVQWLKVKFRDKIGYVYKDYCARGNISTNVTATGNLVDYTNVNVREQPSTEHSRIITTLPAGSSVNIVGQDGSWYLVKLKDGTLGYIRSDKIKTTSSSSAKTLVVTAGRLNVRSGPSTNNSIIGVVASGQRLTYISASGSWFKVKLPSGATGYVHKDYVKKE